MKQKKAIAKFVKNLMCENYAGARENLRDIMVEKLKDRIRNVERTRTIGANN
jgi:hypothetical protein